MPDGKKTTINPTDTEPHYVGHRQRLKERFLKGGAEALNDYELLEMLLFIAIPRRDVKPLSKFLINTFGSFAQVISADQKRLAAIPGIGENTVAALKLVQAAALALMKENITSGPVISSWQALLDYCRASMAYNKIEVFRVLFLDRKNVLIADEVLQEGTIDHTPVYPREVIKRALELGASAIILVHNHPSGDPTPSKNDIDITREILNAGEKLGIAVHDHLIIARKGHTSFKSLGLI